MSKPRIFPGGRRALKDAYRSRLWPLPTMAVLSSVALGIGLTRLDAAVDAQLPPAMSELPFGGDADAARSVLGAIASSMITVTSLTFSLTVVTLQLASSQFSPRLLRTFASDPFVQRTLALFLATFVFALTVLRTVRTGLHGEPDFAPQLSVTVSFLLALASVLGLVLFLAHIVRQIRIETILSHVHNNATATLREAAAEPASNRHSPPPVPPPDARMLAAESSGFITAVGESILREAAEEAGVVLLIDLAPGDHVVAGTPFAFWWLLNPNDSVAEDAVARLHQRIIRAVTIGKERTSVQDVAYGLRQLVDVALKALSPGINDPTTAVHCLGHISALLCEFARHDLGARILQDDASRARVVQRRRSLPELLKLAVEQPLHYGGSDPVVCTQLLLMLRELAWQTRDPVHQRAIAAHLQRIRFRIAKQDFDEERRVVLAALSAAVESARYGVWRPGQGLD
ncbi:DUF2254 domain-containing protein [Paenarthrobacter sp. PH39-S1]|uniref:DUF2254 domain-containing protein n=1 Tax=Paenarthrobacter sp. PH39-S1 TaxID=3046204 RepID=UPI0024B9234F|nr:DUF2254 domain-containing protein [Paenarthrobacter sp. PH39-S1]MDJ0356879.1 DUF2254 domain-containing protein [Paenarthrobacter sp. PH39-S1]